jgi:glycosyltransferase involved in cell wall biosynthesis
MRIAQIAPLCESVPPKLYGGTERVVSYLTEELVRQGHEVSLFASGDSVTAARLIPGCDVALRLGDGACDIVPYHVTQIEQVRARAREFDILHFHTDYLHFPLMREIPTPSVTTLHGRQDLSWIAPFYRAFPEQPLVSISDHQRLPMPPVTWAGTIHHGLPPNLLPFSPSPRTMADGGYLAFLGRISPEKRPDRAIEIALRTGQRLKIAAKIDRVDEEYWTTMIKPMVDRSPLIDYVGEINEAQKAAFLGGATGLLFPIDWPEPFGLVMIEAMSCGTPVLAYGCGSVPEILQDGVTAFLVSSLDEACAAAPRLAGLDRARIRREFDSRFTAATMAANYVKVYESLIAKRAGRPVCDAISLADLAA